MADKTIATKENVHPALKLSDKLCEFLNENVEDDLSNVHECLARMKQQKIDLENQLESSESSEITPSCVDQTLNEAKDVLQNVDTAQLSLSELNISVKEHDSKVTELVNQLQSLNNTVKELENLGCYIKWIQKVEDISNLIHRALESGSLQKATEQLLNMKKLLDQLSGSSCERLKMFVIKTLNHWYKILVEKLSTEFDEVLKILKWPFTSGSTAPPLSAKPDVFKRLENLFIMLLNVSEIDCLTLDKDDNNTIQDSNTTLPMKLLLSPLKKRFIYHFSSKKQTNNLEKPEWFYTQVLNWVRDHEDFLGSIIQPILDIVDSPQLSSASAQAQFTEGLLEVVQEKMKQIVPLLMDDDTIFSHFIDEALLFEQELRDVFNYPVTSDVCLAVLSEEQCFKKWVTLEKRYAMEHVQSLLCSEKAWCPRYQDASDVDDLKVPECVETFVSLLLGITDRYRYLPEEKDRLTFVNIQLDLVFFFMSSLEEVMEQNISTPLNSCFLFIINSTNYLITVLQDWTEQAFFLKLYYEKSRNDRKKKMAEEQESVGALCDDIPPSVESGEVVLDDSFKFPDEDEQHDREGTLFDEAIKQLRSLQNNMLSTLVKHVLEEFKVKSGPYKNESWHSLPSQKELAITCLSSTLCDMIIYLREILGNLKQQLVEHLFTKFWKALTGDLSEFLFDEVILTSHFNEGGAAQLKFDIHKNVFVLFGQFTNKPGNYFKRLKEAIILLNLLPGSAILLKETLESQKQRSTNNEKTCSALDELGIHRLTVNEALNVLNSRINRTK